MTLVARYVDAPGAELLARLRAGVGSDVRILTGTAARTGDPGSPACEVLIDAYPRAGDLAAPGLRALMIPYVGLPEPTRALLLERPQIAVHAVKFNAAPTAELALALLLAAMKNLVAADRELRERRWSTGLASVPVAGRTAVVLGYGGVGSRVAALCAALGMQVAVVRRNAERPTPFPTHRLADLPKLLPHTDALIICLPLTPGTRAVLGGAELARLPRTAVLVNVGRAGVVDEQALFDVLRGRRILAAAADVWFDEPTRLNGFQQVSPSRYPFHELDNVVMSPHRGFRGTQGNEARIDVLAEMLVAAARGERIPGAIDVEAGY